MAAVESALARKLSRFLPLGRDKAAALAGLEVKRRSLTALRLQLIGLGSEAGFVCPLTER